MKRFGEEEIEAVSKVIRSGTLSGYYKNPNGGVNNQALEEKLAKYHGLRNAVTCSNGTTALHLALMALGVGRTEEVIVPPLTFSSTATSVLMVGGEPVFVDVDDSFNMDPSKVEDLITEMTKAIIPVHLLGVPVDMKPLMEIADRHGIPVIEDNAQALGAKYNGQLTGTFGKLSIMSAQETKQITFLGEGGAVLTNDDDLAEKIRLLRNQGSQYANAPFLTYNYRLSEAHAAFGLVQMDKLDYFNELEVNNARRFMDAVDQAKLPIVFQHSGLKDYATRYIIGSSVIPHAAFKRAEYVHRLTDIGVNRNLPGATIGLGYTRTIMDLPVLQRYKRSCPVAEDLVKRFIWFDCLRWKEEAEADKTIDALVDIAREVWKV